MEGGEASLDEPERLDSDGVRWREGRSRLGL
jgi:hypothetical protein